VITVSANGLLSAVFLKFTITSNIKLARKDRALYVPTPFLRRICPKRSHRLDDFL